MRISLAITAAILMLFCVSNTQAEIYTCKDAKGNTVYTDSPAGCANAEEIKVDTLPTLVPSKSIAVPRSSNSSGKEDDKDTYSELVITSPSNDSTLRDNQGNLTINFRASPALQTRKGHTYVVMVDGAEVYSGTSTITALKNVDRGTHNIVVKIVDPEGNMKISAAPVKVTLQRFSAKERIDLPGSGGVPTLGDTGSGQFSFPTLPRSVPPSTPTPTSPPTSN